MHVDVTCAVKRGPDGAQPQGELTTGKLPIIAHESPRLAPQDVERVEALADELRRQRPALILPGDRAHLADGVLDDAPSLHLEDLSAIAEPAVGFDTTYIQDRARLRATDGDVVAIARPPAPGYEEYCAEMLGLGSPAWISSSAGESTRHLASLCWTDRKMRRALTHAVRADGLRYIHPFMGGREVWELAALLQDATRRPVKVIAPPPGVTTWANDKVAFSETVARLFGERLVPVTRSACNLALLSHRVRELASRSQAIGLKVPDAAGGLGNLVVDASRYRGRSLRSIRRSLRRQLSRIGWRPGRELMVDRWEVDAVAAPSAQLWIPHDPEQTPVIEGLFEQVLAGPTPAFVGVRPATLPAAQRREIGDRCALLGLLFQRLGYVGRCSFDMILAGRDLRSARLEFIECNGRWGGTSLPMTLMNRLLGDWQRRPFVVHCAYVHGVERLGFDVLLRCFERELFDARTGRGRLILFNPARLRARSGVEVVALGDSDEEAAHLAEIEVPRRLRALVRATGAG